MLTFIFTFITTCLVAFYFRSKLVTPSVNPYNVFITGKKQYLKSKEWNTKRKATLARDNYTCQSCGATGVPLEVHHIHYHTFGIENGSELVSVCRSCHQAVHDKHGYGYNSTYPVN